MALLQFNHCPSTLAEGFDSYSPLALKQLFNGKKVGHMLAFPSPRKSEETMNMFVENMKHISVSGFQIKCSVVQVNKLLRLTNKGEKGTHILKPIPGALLKKLQSLPANENLTMQLASQVFGIKTAANGLIFFDDGEPAYLTKRFDFKDEATGEKWGQEDLATLAGKTTYSSGEKYDYSYEEAGSLIRKYVSAWPVEIEKYFSLLVFNYLFSNGDAHLKNFSLLEDVDGDYRLSPAYDLVNTRLHVDDSDFALSKGLFADGYQSEDWKTRGHPSHIDFKELAKRLGVVSSRINKLLQPFLEKQPNVELLVSRSFLTSADKRGYLLMYQTKRNYLLGSGK